MTFSPNVYCASACCSGETPPPVLVLPPPPIMPPMDEPLKPQAVSRTDFRDTETFSKRDKLNVSIRRQPPNCAAALARKLDRIAHELDGLIELAVISANKQHDGFGFSRKPWHDAEHSDLKCVGRARRVECHWRLEHDVAKPIFRGARVVAV